MFINDVTGSDCDELRWEDVDVCAVREHTAFTSSREEEGKRVSERCSGIRRGGAREGT